MQGWPVFSFTRRIASCSWLVRVAAEFVHPPGPANLMLLAALRWLLVFGLWYARYAPSYLKRRPDGRPG